MPLDGSGPGGWGAAPRHTPPRRCADGSHTFEVRATDAAGNTDATPASRTFTVDTTPPTTAITGAPPAHTNDTTPTFAFDSALRRRSELRVPPRRKRSRRLGSCTSPHTTASLSDGSHTFEVRATDAAGNTDATPEQATFTVDTVAPTTTIIGEPLSPGNDQTPSFTFASNEAGASFECSVDAGPFTSCSSPHEPASLPAGQHSFDVRAVDQAGNTDATPEHRTFVVDLTPPDTRITSGPEGTLRATTATFAFSATEPGSTFQCRLDDGAFATCGGTTATFDGLAEGAHRFEVRAVDSAGNPDPTPAASEFTVDSKITGLSVSAARKQRTKPKKPRVTVLVSAGERVDVHAGRQAQARQEVGRARHFRRDRRRRLAPDPAASPAPPRRPQGEEGAEGPRQTAEQTTQLRVKLSR
ncbi:MAG: Ig-like domain-containing protein [Solirubrobacterales bacterium]